VSTTNRQHIFSWSRSFHTKFLLVTGISVLLGAVLNTLVARQGIHKLSGEAAQEIETGLDAANREYLTKHVVDKAQRTNLALSQPSAEIQTLAAVSQTMIDHHDEFQPLIQAVANIPYFKDKLVYNPKTNWTQNGPDEPTVVNAWGYLAKDGVLKPGVQEAIDSSALMDLLFPSFKPYGAEKLQFYYVGSLEYPYMRLGPYTDIGAAFDKLYPGHNDEQLYKFFWPGMVESWQAWLKEPAGLKGHPTQITVTAPYEDAAGGGIVMTFCAPLWSKDRTAFAGMVALDQTANQIISYINDVKLAQTGFAFLAQSDGNVLAVNDAGARKLDLQQRDKKAAAGLAVLNRFLKDSGAPEIAKLALPKDDKIQYREILLAGEPHIIVLQRLAPLNYWLTAGASVATESWTLGFVIPKREMYASLYVAKTAIEQTQTNIVTSQAVVAGASFLVLMAGVYLVSRRMTGALVALSSGATRMRKGDYGARVDVSSEDEIGQLSVAFNDMASEIQAYTGNLEGLVQERTKDLEAAADEIRELNAKLAQENLRLGAELDVARRLQLMVLPPVKELQEIPGLDIAGYMAPADEVGGDYYDVLRSNGLIKMGIGDVTGHGLESGVLMLMVQTAVRTLLASNEQDPRRFLNIVNKVIYENVKRISSDKNLTLSLIDYRDGVLKLTGQHEDLIIVRQDGTLERIDTTDLGLPVGLDFDISEFISSVDVRLDPGDVATLFTDGVTEADNAENRQYGIERLCEVILQNHTLGSKQIKEAIVADVMSHIGKSKIYDDITVLVIKRR
jgi:phosphoserine phosphatase RsbU/P